MNSAGRKSADFRAVTSHELLDFVFTFVVLKAKLKDLAIYVNIEIPLELNTKPVLFIGVVVPCFYFSCTCICSNFI